MKHIYLQAREVLVWLGEEEELDEIAFALLKRFQVCFDEHGFFEFGVDNKRDVQRGLPPSDAPDWWALARLYRKSYFERVWVIQEVVRARKARIFCGDLFMDWATLALVSRSVQMGGGIIGNQEIWSCALGCIAVNDIENIKIDPEVNVLHLLESTRNHLATDPRDKVFALEGVSESFRLGVIVDYSISAEDTYIALAVHSLTVLKTLRCLSSAGMTSEKRSLTLPSWVPDWSHQSSRRSTIGFHGCFSAARSSSPFISVSAEKVLTIQGFVFDAINIISSVARAIELPETVHQDGLDVSSTLRINSTKKGTDLLNRVKIEASLLYSANSLANHARPSTFPPSQNVEDAVWRTLLCDMTDDYHQAPPSFHRDFQVTHQVLAAIDLETGTLDEAVLRKLANTLENVETPISRKFTHAWVKFGIARRMCVTAKGYLAHAVAEVQEGDQVVIFSSADVPFLLRPNGDGSYLLVGECYVHGIMYGEAMKAREPGGGTLEDFRIR